MEVPDPTTRPGCRRSPGTRGGPAPSSPRAAGTSIAGARHRGGGGPGNVTIASEALAVPNLLGRAGLIRPDIVTRPRPRRDVQPAAAAVRDGDRGAVPARDLAERTGRLDPRDRAGRRRGRAAPHRALAHAARRPRRGGRRVTVDERRSTQRVVRALWARDREGPELFEGALGGVAFPNWQNLKWPGRWTSRSAARSTRATATCSCARAPRPGSGRARKPIPPEPVDVEGLWLSALGAWLDLHGEWNTDPYSQADDRGRSCSGITSRRWAATSTCASSTPATSSRSGTRRRWSR